MASLTCGSEIGRLTGRYTCTCREPPARFPKAGDSLPVRRGMRLPAQHTQNQIKHEKGAEDHETDKVHPWKLKAHCVIHLEGPAEEEEEQWEERRRNRVKKTHLAEHNKLLIFRWKQMGSSECLDRIVLSE